MSTVLETFEGWKSFLEERIEQARETGMKDDTIAKIAFQIGEFLDEKIEPRNDEERLLKSLWDVGSKDERKTIAKLMVKLVEKK